MSVITPENGKRIDEIASVVNLSTDAKLLAVDESLTRSITLKNLRLCFNGDDATLDLNNVYYSVNAINNKIATINTMISTVDEKIAAVANTLINNLTGITTSVSNLANELKRIEIESKDRDNKLSTTINNVNTSLTKNITDVNSTLNARVDTVETTINNRITTEVNTLNTTIATKETESKKRDTDLGTRITNEVKTINNTITTKEAAINKTITDKETAINNTINTKVSDINTTIATKETESKKRDSDLDTKITNLNSSFTSFKDRFSIGHTIPTTLKEGYVYFQYFD